MDGLATTVTKRWSSKEENALSQPLNPDKQRKKLSLSPSSFGTEHEKLAYYVDSGKRLEYKTIAALLSQLCARFGWEPIVEAGEIIGATFDGQSVTLEPGGQLELSGAPVDTLHKTCAEVNSHLYQVKAISEELGVKFLGLGFDPKW